MFAREKTQRKQMGREDTQWFIVGDGWDHGGFSPAFSYFYIF